MTQQSRPTGTDAQLQIGCSERRVTRRVFYFLFGRVITPTLTQFFSPLTTQLRQFRQECRIGAFLVSLSTSCLFDHKVRRWVILCILFSAILNVTGDRHRISIQVQAYHWGMSSQRDKSALWLTLLMCRTNGISNRLVRQQKHVGEPSYKGWGKGVGEGGIGILLYYFGTLPPRIGIHCTPCFHIYIFSMKSKHFQSSHYMTKNRCDFSLTKG